MYWSKGTVTRQAHVGIPEGTVEEEYARNGFFGRTAHLYRRHAPVDWIDIDGELRPRALSCDDLAGLGDDWLAGRVAFLENADVTLSWASLATAMPYCFRDADADEVLFVHAGAGRMETDFGLLSWRKGDYLVVPRGTVYRLMPSEPSRFLVIATADEVVIPERGIVGQHALFDPAVLDVPEPGPVEEPDRAWQLRILRAGRLTTVTYPHHPITTVGWKGDLTVWKLNVDDIRPMLSERYHLPPTAHVTWMTNNVVICSFLPRPLETGDPTALRVPFFHANVDYDEVLFYHDGNFFSREGIDAGMVTFHPAGIHHGPQPGAVAAASTKTRTDEKAVMVDTRRPLEPTAAFRAAENPDYWTSWMGRAERAVQAAK
jgi:homogentisate 1,2-dioxygenase